MTDRASMNPQVSLSGQRVVSKCTTQAPPVPFAEAMQPIAGCWAHRHSEPEPLITDYHGADVEEMLAALIDSAARTGLLTGAEAGAIAVTAPPSGPHRELPLRLRRQLAAHHRGGEDP
jgi:hypothetical protein